MNECVTYLRRLSGNGNDVYSCEHKGLSCCVYFTCTADSCAEQFLLFVVVENLRTCRNGSNILVASIWRWGIRCADWADCSWDVLCSPGQLDGTRNCTDTGSVLTQTAYRYVGCMDGHALHGHVLRRLVTPLHCPTDIIMQQEEVLTCDQEIGSQVVKRRVLLDLGVALACIVHQVGSNRAAAAAHQPFSPTHFRTHTHQDSACKRESCRVCTTAIRP